MSETTESPNSSMPQQKKAGGDYPVSESFKVLERYDIYRSPKLIGALVVVDSDFGRDLRLYRWQKRNDAWKVDLYRMSVASWKWNEIASKSKELIQKYEIGRKKEKQSAAVQNSEAQ